MIIVSQDKRVILNFENIESIFIDINESGREIDAVLRSGSIVILGKYKTKERVKEVLQEIITVFEDKEILHIRKSTLNNLDELEEPKYILKPVSRPKVFEMPLE